MRVLQDAGRVQGGFGAAEGASQPLTVLHEAAGVGMRNLQVAGRDHGGWSVAECRRHQLAVLLRIFFYPLSWPCRMVIGYWRSIGYAYSGLRVRSLLAAALAGSQGLLKSVFPLEMFSKNGMCERAKKDAWASALRRPTEVCSTRACRGRQCAARPAGRKCAPHPAAGRPVLPLGGSVLHPRRRSLWF